MREIKFRKPFKLITDDDVGYETNAIIAFEKRPWMYNAIALSDVEALKKGYGIEQTVTQYRYRLMIDLWIVTFYFQWDGRLSPLPTK